MKSPVAMPIEQRIVGKAILDDNGCWLWTGGIAGGGYAYVGIPGTRLVRRAHRVFYQLVFGPVAAGLDLDHLCRVRRCVNPFHLEPVTRRVNLLRGLLARHGNRSLRLIA